MNTAQNFSISGVLINGPFSLITTAVSAELGQHESLRGSSKATATVTAIIDGSGSIGNILKDVIIDIGTRYKMVSSHK